PPFQGNTVTKGSGGYWEPDGVPPSPPSQSVYYWHEYENNVPAAAATTNTRFRWAQLATSSSGYDAWGIDEVEIYCPGQQNISWSNGIQAFNAGWVKPSATKTYTVFILDTSGNSASANVTVNVIPEPEPGLGPDTIICEDPNSYATLEADSGFDTYLWNTGATSQTIQVDSTANYSVTVTKGNCTGSDSVNVAVEPKPVADTGPDEEICIGDSITLSAATVNNAEYIWNTGDTAQSVTVSPKQDSVYVLDVVTPLGCRSTDSIQVKVNPLPNADAGPVKEICNGDQVDLTASGGQVYEWSTNDMVSTITVSPTDTTEYYVTVTDANGCVNNDTTRVLVNPLPVVEATSQDSAICLGDETELYASGADTYNWSVGNSGSNIFVQPMSSTTYTVTGTDQNGCKSTANTTVIAEDCSSFYIPNAFTPDGDGLNDVFRPLGQFAAIDEYEMIIYNRFGDVIFQSEDPQEGWNGIIDGEYAPHGVYVYYVHYKSIWGKEFEKTGSVTLLK
ncbi:MAG: gliding motility-associated C-terminal domain-containing protein, partial [Bacteroidales bacterium]|nr:gliding motility-associated C-terminal domain-containing protein [Bacteroidales bacterium]